MNCRCRYDRCIFPEKIAIPLKRGRKRFRRIGEKWLHFLHHLFSHVHLMHSTTRQSIVLFSVMIFLLLFGSLTNAFGRLNKTKQLPIFIDNSQLRKSELETNRNKKTIERKKKYSKNRENVLRKHERIKLIEIFETTRFVSDGIAHRVFDWHVRCSRLHAWDGRPFGTLRIRFDWSTQRHWCSRQIAMKSVIRRWLEIQRIDQPAITLAHRDVWFWLSRGRCVPSQQIHRKLRLSSSLFSHSFVSLFCVLAARQMFDVKHACTMANKECDRKNRTE